jgi:glutathione S-transferase
MSLKIYGIPRTRTIRCLWLAEELGLPYERLDAGVYTDGKRNAELERVNPSAQVPALDDGGFHLAESMAINLYLAKKDGRIYPKTLQEEAKCWQWSFWVMSNCDRQVTEWAMHDHALPAAERRPDIARAKREELERPLAHLDRKLAGRNYLVVPDAFTVGDLNVAATLYRLKWMELAGKPNLDRWYKACWARPSGVKARAMRGD